ncbi:hypothetical protein E1A91_D13G224800v1 [Gossypium mustelinum]|uniref:Exostosin GT47 domain-containing protein n=1 Tax=Gossypium mustelinum TaxID=34275 RepID=A0A5D2S8U7_GOSMU|nr:hypothetical protein E1A91_D13G224800v1 [Gossypium mustelinum]
MGHELKSLTQLDTRKLIWLIGITFAVIVTFQYIELPYGNVLWSLFPSGKVSVDEKSSFLASGPSSAESGFYFNGTNAGNETVHDDEIFEGKDIDTDVITEADVGLNKSSTFDEGTKAWKESSTAEPVELNNNSTADKAGNETAHDDEIFEGRDIDTDVITEADVGLNKSSTFDEGTKAWKESSTAEPVELNKNSTVDNAGNETAHDDEIFEGRDIDTDIITEADVGLNKSSTFNEGTKAPKESSTAELVELNKNSTVNNAESSKSEEFEKDSNITSLNNLNQTGAVNETAKADDFTPEVGLNRSSILDKELDERSNITVLNMAESSNNKSVAENVGTSEESFASKNDTVDINTSNNNAPDTGLGTTNSTSEKGVETNISAPVVSFNSSISSVEQHVTPSFDKNEKPKPKPIQNDFTKPSDNSSPRKAPKMKKKPEMLPPAVTTIADMNNLLYQSRVSYESPTPKWSSRADKVLLEARLQIENAPIIKNDPQLYAPLFRNLSMFKRSYELMENTLKVYVYKEGKRPIVHTPVLRGIYASEGWFMKQLETNKKFVTKNPRDAHLFYLPFSSRMLEETLYVPDSHSHKNLIEYLKNYVDTIAAKYPFWNRTEGADHFLVACHDWAPSETRNHMANCIRALCNSDVREGYVFGKDVSLPETYVRNPQKPLRDLGGNPPSKRPILAFFAGSMHGYLRPILLEQWGNKDPDMKIFGKMPNVKGKMNYIRHMKSSKYCLCPRGYEVNSPRVVEAIFYECVPVIISDNFVPPFFEVLNWESFSVFILEKDIPNLKKILLSIPDKRYRQMQLRVKKIQQHFLWHPKPEKYDIFHMILHSVWYNRVFQMKPR